MASGFGDRFREIVCAHEMLFMYALALAGTLSVLSLVSLAFVRPGTATHSILLLDLLLLGVVFVASVGALAICRRWRQKQRW